MSADRTSNESLLCVCMPLFVACIFAWTFPTFPEPHRGTLPVLVVVHESGNIALELASRGVEQC